MKNVQISKELFLALLHYHLDGEDEYADEIVQGLEQKLEAQRAATCTQSTRQP